MFLENSAKQRDVGILLIRVGLALVFIVHGWAKFGDLDSFLGFVSSLGFGAPFAYAVATVELLGGLSILLGIFTRISGLLLAINMLFVISLVKIKAGFVGGYEFELLLLLVSLGIAYLGPGRFSIQRLKSLSTTPKTKLD